MAVTQYGLNHPLAVKAWARKLFHEALKQTVMAKFIGTDSSSLIYVKDDLQKGPGDRVRIGLRMLLTGDGVLGDNTLEGNEESLTVYSDDLYIDQLRHAVRIDGKMSEQRIPFDAREEARMGLQDWYADRIDRALLNQLGGNTAQTDLRYTGGNACVAPDTNHVIYANGNTTEASVATETTSAVFNLNLIDKCVERAKTLTPVIRPLRVAGQDKYVIILHPYQVYDLRVNTSTGQWLDIQKAAAFGGQVTNNPIYTGALGEYNGVIIHEDIRVPTVVSTVYRAVFCGAQAGCIAYGQMSGQNKMNWVEEMFDFQNQFGVATSMIWGAKKSIYNSTDFATIAVATYGVQHT